MKITIKNRWSGSTIYEGEHETLKDAVASAIANRAVLTDADLTGADLRRAILTRADLTRAILTRADLTRAILTRADLTGADLTGAVLTDAVLTDAVLTGADLTRAILTGADLTRAILTDADLTGADLRPIRDDIWAVLSAAPHEVEGLRAAIAEGRINGSAYEGECACLVGTIANIAHCNYKNLPVLKPDPSRPAERWFLGIKPGDTVETSEVVKITIEWVDAWLANMRSAFGAK